MNSEVLPVGTESLLNSLGYVRVQDVWLRTVRAVLLESVPAGSGEPDRLGRVAAARMSEVSPEKKSIPERDLNCGLWAETGE
jgi:hypothetical protein